MHNSTDEVLFQLEEEDFEHPLHVKITLSILTILIVFSIYFVDRKLFSFLRRPNRRCIGIMGCAQSEKGI